AIPLSATPSSRSSPCCSRASWWRSPPGKRPVTAALLAAVAALVGFFIGAVGVGGVLLIPALAVLGGLDIHRASATALFTFLFTGLLGTWLFYRRGSMDWRLTLPVCAGSVAFSYLGAMVNAMVAPRRLAALGRRRGAFLGAAHDRARLRAAGGDRHQPGAADHRRRLGLGRQPAVRRDRFRGCGLELGVRPSGRNPGRARRARREYLCPAPHGRRPVYRGRNVHAGAESVTA